MFLCVWLFPENPHSSNRPTALPVFWPTTCVRHVGRKRCTPATATPLRPRPCPDMTLLDPAPVAGQGGHSVSLNRPPSLPACPPAHPRARPPPTTGRPARPGAHSPPPAPAPDHACGPDLNPASDRSEPSLPACTPARPPAPTTGRAPAPPARAPTHPRPPRRPTTLAAQTLTPRPIAQNLKWARDPGAHPRCNPTKFKCDHVCVIDFPSAATATTAIDGSCDDRPPTPLAPVNTATRTQSSSTAVPRHCNATAKSSAMATPRGDPA